MAVEQLDLDRLLVIAQSAPPVPSSEAKVFPAESLHGKPIGLAVARDEAFSFYYQDNLDLLAAFGARLLPFSPLRNSALPSGTRGIYLGGGFPELQADRLAANASLLADVRRAAADGLPIYAECGGLMYLSEGLTDFEGRHHRMTGLIRCRVEMMHRRAALGYVRLQTARDTLISPAGRELRGHEFHWSRLASGSDDPSAYNILEPGQRSEGFARGNLLASYVHLHFGADPDLARRFVAALRLG